jgi:hypothetical protein
MTSEKTYEEDEVEAADENDDPKPPSPKFTKKKT